ANEEMYIVQREEAQPENLVGDEEVAYVCPREAPARGAIASLLDRARIGAVFGAFDVEPSVAGERGAVAPHAGGGHAVEEVDAAAYAFDEVFREAHSHEIARAIGGQGVVDGFEDAIHV